MPPNDSTVNAVIYCAPMHELGKNIKNRIQGILSGRVIILHDNARPHVAVGAKHCYGNSAGRFLNILTARTSRRVNNTFSKHSIKL
ncbi:hypothetical protein TNCV_3892021 [Trichonephila clavipes]|nr:hypothetical protein TNCV_3892021 [Trichonephila clavipes]